MATVHYYCTKDDSRVFPFSKWEGLTLAPNTNVLLKSFNHKVGEDDRVGWCWSCKAFRPLRRLGEVEILRMYVTRRGVRMREPKPEGKVVVPRGTTKR